MKEEKEEVRDRFVRWGKGGEEEEEGENERAGK